MTSPHEYDLETLMAYVRGDLDAKTATVIDAAAAHDLKLAAELALLRGVRLAESERVTQTPSTELGWARLSKAIDHNAPRQGWRDTRLALWQVAACAVGAVALWQTVAVPMLTSVPVEPHVYVAASEPTAAVATLKVMFQESVTEAEFRALLISIDARVTDGPSAIGLYTLSFDSEEERDRAETALKAAVDTVDMVQRD